MEVTLGGDRLGSGGKMNVDLHTYNRSTHNLSKNFLSTMAPGVLYPFYQNIGLNGDTFEIDLEAAVRTLPTQGPLFGSFKLQADIFVAPIRLYQGILHNNPINIGMQMNQVFFPQIQVNSVVSTTVNQVEQINKSTLLNYLGIRGLGTEETLVQNGSYRQRNFNGLGLLCYYDIAKNYYCNKQEKKAYVISSNAIENIFESMELYYSYDKITPVNYINLQKSEQIGKTVFIAIYKQSRFATLTRTEVLKYGTLCIGGGETNYFQLKEFEEFIDEISTQDPYNIKVVFEMSREDLEKVVGKAKAGLIFPKTPDVVGEQIPILLPFELENIDEMRRQLLSNNQIGEKFLIGKDTHFEPYQTNFDGFTTYKQVFDENIPIYHPKSLSPMNGLMVKTYQSDLFNNWIQTDYITGENGINEITKIDTSAGLVMDALNFAQKVYNMLNRIATMGGTFQDWQDAVYTGEVKHFCETPMWKGGYTTEVVFEEVVQTSATEDTPLGQLGGKGRSVGKVKGGRIEFKVTEPSIIMGIISLTPRVTYSQGNKWFNTELETMDDLHKPALDGIGFQELITEQMAWYDTQLEHSTHRPIKKSVGFTPAWINYMTDIDEVYGDFAEPEKSGFMVLGRNYGRNSQGISDLTTYIDPSKFNYAFADAELTAQNFWVEARMDVKARRLMSAKVIPNL